MSWLNVLIAIAVIPAIGGWGLAAISAIRIFAMVPKGQRFAAYNDLGMWRFAKLRGRTGPAADPWIKRMKQGGIAFALSVLVILVIAAVGIPFGTQTSAAGTAALPGPINGASYA